MGEPATRPYQQIQHTRWSLINETDLLQPSDDTYDVGEFGGQGSFFLRERGNSSIESVVDIQERIVEGGHLVDIYMTR